MPENREFSPPEEKSLESLPNNGELLLADDPALHRLVKQRLQKNLASRKKVSENSLPKKTVDFLTEEVKLQNTDFLSSHEQLRQPVFEKIITNIAHLDFRGFSDAQHGEFSLYDPEVITPQVSWAVEQIFQNLPGFFSSFLDSNPLGETTTTEQVDTIRNIFILGYLHGFLKPTSENFPLTKEYLAFFMRKSDVFADKLKSYPEFLRKLVELENDSLSSPRLEQLKKHWGEQFARRWLMLVRTGVASEKTLSPATTHQQQEFLPPDRRPTPNLGSAERMDLKNGPQVLGHENTVAKQRRAEWSNRTEATALSSSATAHLRKVLQLYQGNDQELFHNGTQVSEKWLPYKRAANQILQNLISGHALLHQANDVVAFNATAAEIVSAMVNTLNSAAGSQPITIEQLFGSDFFGLEKVEQLSLLCFTALSFINQENGSIKIAIQILDTEIVPKLNQYADLDKSQQLFSDTAKTLQYSEFDQSAFEAKSDQAKKALDSLVLTDGLISVDSSVFAELLKTKKLLLKKVAWVNSLFAKGIGENWLDKLPFKPALVWASLVLTGMVSGYLNFNLSQNLLETSLTSLFAEDPWLQVLKGLGTLSVGLGGKLLLGQASRRNFRKLSLSSPELSQELKKITKTGFKEIALVLTLWLYASGSTYPLWQEAAENAWNELKDRMEEKADGGHSKNPYDQAFWENRNPESIDPDELETIEKSVWGELVIGDEVYGKSENAEIGFINTFKVSPTLKTDDIQEFETTPIQDVNSKVLYIYAQSAVVEDDRIVFTLNNGETFIQEAAGTDFIVKNGLSNGKDGFLRFLDSDRVIAKIIGVPREYDPEVNTASTETYRYLDVAVLAEQIIKYYDYYIVYETSEQLSYMQSASNSEVFWAAYAAERQVIPGVLEKENPDAAALYNQMLSEQELFWENYSQHQSDNGEYWKMVHRQLGQYDAFVKTNHVYSLRYAPKTNYAEQYPTMGVMFDVMALKKGGYYCQTAHLSAQQWFLSLGVPLDGLYGYSVFDDAGSVASRIGHVKTGFYDTVHDFTPTTPNPGEDLSSLSFNPNEPVDSVTGTQAGLLEKESQLALELLMNLASVENLALAILTLTTIISGYSVKLGAELLREKFKKRTVGELEQIKKLLPTNEVELRCLAAAFLQFINLLSETPDLPNSKIIQEVLILASKPVTPDMERGTLSEINPKVFSLLKLTGLSHDPLSAADSSSAISLWQKISGDQKVLTATLQESIASLALVSAETQKTLTQRKSALNHDVRRLQKQLMRVAKKERRLYGNYGDFLERSKLINPEKLDNTREKTTTDHFVISQELEKKKKELAQLVLQTKLLPSNTRNLKKLFSFMLQQIEENKTNA